jgi:type III restriction enzyme
MTIKFMNEDFALKYIKTAMSLREPQLKSLKLFGEYLKSDAGKKLLSRMNKEKRNNTSEILLETKKYFSQISEARGFEEFERKFPAFTFALATGVGKTRLMGAFVAYLYLVYGIQHFLIVAPNLTIYRKLLDDFSKSNNPKYVFKGIQEINTTTARVITTDNYVNESGKQLFGNQLEINIFNIQQFAQKDMASERGITKMWETAGESYFDYLKSHNDLVVMLDEAHHYHADAALGALDILDPLFALEMTATPYLVAKVTGNKSNGKKASQVKMKNVLYSYNLGDAIRGKLVKDPWIGTEADIDFKNFDLDSIEADTRKLQLACYFHQRAKNALKQYALENNKKLVKPVLLVVAKNTDHATELKNLIDSDNFRGGEFKGKTIEIHTKLKGEEADGNIEKLISLEHEDNMVEVIIHVNMLKEGWDVANVYTIAPLRESAATILTEQTLGRGLRLPYGERTGVQFVDRLVIVAHEQFAKVIKIANDSELIQGQVEQIFAKELKEEKVVIEVQPVVLLEAIKEIQKNEVIMQAVLESAKEEISKHPQIEKIDLTIRQKMVESKVESRVLDLGKKAILHQSESLETLPLFGYSNQAKEEFEKITFDSKQQKNRTISIPRLDIRPTFDELLIHDFDLDINKLRFYSNEKNVIEEQLQNNLETNLLNENILGHNFKEITKVSSLGGYSGQSPQSAIISALIDYDIIDYDDPKQKPILLKLANQAVEHYSKMALNKENLLSIVEGNSLTIAEDIYKQISGHVVLKSLRYQSSEIGKPKPFLESHNLAIGLGEVTVSLQSQKDSFSKNYIYGYFQKSCHDKYRFDSSVEARLAYLLETDGIVECWLRPAPKQFEGLFWRDGKEASDHKYEPDFVVELKDEIILVEVKPREELENLDVLEKKRTAEEYCKLISQNIGKFNINKSWRYVIVPTHRISLNSTIDSLLK